MPGHGSCFRLTLPVSRCLPSARTNRLVTVLLRPTEVPRLGLVALSSNMASHDFNAANRPGHGGGVGFGPPVGLLAFARRHGRALVHGPQVFARVPGARVRGLAALAPGAAGDAAAARRQLV